MCDCGHEPVLHFSQNGGCGIQNCGCKWSRSRIYFETWAKKKNVDLSRDRTDKGYWYDEAKSLWECWQAGVEAKS